MAETDTSRKAVATDRKNGSRKNCQLLGLSTGGFQWLFERFTNILAIDWKIFHTFIVHRSTARSRKPTAELAVLPDLRNEYSGRICTYPLRNGLVKSITSFSIERASKRSQKTSERTAASDRNRRSRRHLTTANQTEVNPLSSWRMHMFYSGAAVGEKY